MSPPYRTTEPTLALVLGIRQAGAGFQVAVMDAAYIFLCGADPSILLQGLRALAHGQAHGCSGKDDRSHGSERENRSTVHPVGVGDRPWVILPASCCQISAKFFGMMVARDGVEPPTPAFSELIFPVFPTTSRVAVGLLNTGKYEQH